MKVGWKRDVIPSRMKAAAAGVRIEVLES